MIVKRTGTQIGVDGALYAAGQCLGALQTLPSALFTIDHDRRQAVLTGLVVHDLTNQKSALDVVIFDSNPSATTFTDNAALDIADADLPKIIARISVLAADYVSYADNAEATLKGLGIDLAPATIAGNLYMILVCRGAPTYVANELSINLNIGQG